MPHTVEIIRRDLVAEIRFSNPPSNFANPALIGGIADALEVVDGDASLRCSLLTSVERPFCAGADLASSEEMRGAGAMDVIADLYAQAERLFRRRKPMVAAIQGAAVGAGLGLALAADVRVAALSARFSANFVRLGFHAGFGLTATLPRLIGAQRATLMMLTAQRVKPEVALDWGLVDALSEADDLLAHAGRVAWSIAANAPLSLVAMRASMTGDVADAVAAAMAHEHAEQARLMQTEDYHEGVAAVFQGRDPDFSGR